MNGTYTHIDKWMASQCNYFTKSLSKKSGQAPELLTTKQKWLLENLKPYSLPQCFSAAAQQWNIISWFIMTSY